MSKANWDHRKQPTNVKRLTANVDTNNGIAADHDFSSEKEFHTFLKDWLTDKTIKFAGQHGQETSETAEWDKKRTATIEDIEIDPSTESGFGDIGIYHDFVHLAWNHALANPFIIECKNTTFRDAVTQAVRYKSQSEKKYQEQGKYQFVQTGIATPKSLSTGEIAGRHTVDQDNTHCVFPINFEAKRIYWKLGIGVVQSINPDQLVLSFNEGDVVVIE